MAPPDRKRVLAGLSAGPRRIAAALLDSYGPWDAASLETLRAYVLSCARLERLQQDPGDDTRALHREVRTNLALLKSLELETMKRRRQVADMPALCAHTAAVLIAGWGAEAPPDVPSTPDGVGDSFLELYAIGGIAALWRAHEGGLRARAAEWDWAPKYMHNGQPMFYGERAAAGGEEG